MVNRLLDFRSHLHQVETPVPWLVFVTVPVAELAWTLAGVLFDVPPVYSSGWTPYVLLVRLICPLSTLQSKGNRYYIAYTKLVKFGTFVTTYFKW